MNRRDFIASTSTAAIVAALPVSVAQPAISTSRPLRWFAVGHSDEFCEPILAESIEAACREYALYSGHTKGDECPECGECECKAHLTEAQWDDPQDSIMENSSEPRAWAGLEHEPTGVDWLRAGFNTYCEEENCWTRKAYWETTECWPYQGKALCEECLDRAKRRNETTP